MAKASSLFNEMTRRVKKLKSKYMARQVRNERNAIFVFDEINMAAFRLLVHAEYEEYIETKALESLNIIKADVAMNGYSTSHIKNIFAIARQVDKNLNIDKPFDEQNFKDIVNKIILEAEKKVRDNNGIKKNSFLILSLFCGYEDTSIDPLLLTNLESYGKDRGNVAHKSLRGVGRTISFLAPSAEVQNAENIRLMLRKHFYNF
ncbi:hypothetical protein ACK08B_16175 [Pantoea dispersa]|uniref:hypothetical protein n=1 Tax=Pantoea dispersa TaxID=59814 RepID=UPI00398A28A0